MFFDAVLDEEMRPIFNGTPAQTYPWVLEHLIFAPDLKVCVGRTLKIVSFEEYIQKG